MIEFSNLFGSIFVVSKSRVTFLPQKLTCSQEWLWMFKLPSNDVVPLVEFVWQITIGLNPLGKCWVHASLASWSNCDMLC